MDTDQVTSQVVLAAEGPAAAAMGAHEGLFPVGIMRGHVSLQVVCPGKRYKKELSMGALMGGSVTNLWDTHYTCTSYEGLLCLPH